MTSGENIFYLCLLLNLLNCESWKNFLSFGDTLNPRIPVVILNCISVVKFPEFLNSKVMSKVGDVVQ